MNLTLTQNRFSDVKLMSFDAIIVASGFEDRASYQSKEFESLPSKKIALCFDTESEDEIRQKNDDFFRRKGFEMIQMNSDIENLHKLQVTIENIVGSYPEKKDIRIYIDYSSMIRNWYATIIHSMSSLKVE